MLFARSDWLLKLGISTGLQNTMQEVWLPQTDLDAIFSIEILQDNICHTPCQFQTQSVFTTQPEIYFLDYMPALIYIFFTMEFINMQLCSYCINNLMHSLIPTCFSNLV